VGAMQMSNADEQSKKMKQKNSKNGRVEHDNEKPEGLSVILSVT